MAKMYRVLAMATALIAAPVSAQQPGGDATAAAFARYITTGALPAGEAEFAKRPGDPQSVAALGMVQFLRGVERLTQGLYRHGLRPPEALRGMPFVRLPVPENPNPEPLTYEKMRAIYVAFAADLAQADATLAKLPSGAVKLPVDLNEVRLDMNGDGKHDDGEKLSAILARLRMAPPNGGPPFEVAFDRADVVWLRGYSHLLSAGVKFVLAYDWRETFAASAHLFFAGATDPTGGVVYAPSPMLGRESGNIADAIAMLHLIRWPLAEPARMTEAKEHLKKVVALSRENWKEILAETDDDREWVPGPQQKNSAFPGMGGVTREQVDAWLEAIADFEAVLEGRKLIPHWRYAQGIDLAAVFDKPRPFDFVLWITGHAAIPYLKDGPVMSQANWRQWQRSFGGNFLNYAVWFN